MATIDPAVSCEHILERSIAVAMEVIEEWDGVGKVSLADVKENLAVFIGALFELSERLGSFPDDLHAYLRSSANCRVVVSQAGVPSLCMTTPLNEETREGVTRAFEGLKGDSRMRVIVPEYCDSWSWLGDPKCITVLWPRLSPDIGLSQTSSMWLERSALARSLATTSHRWLHLACSGCCDTTWPLHVQRLALGMTVTGVVSRTSISSHSSRTVEERGVGVSWSLASSESALSGLMNKRKRTLVGQGGIVVNGCVEYLLTPSGTLHTPPDSLQGHPEAKVAASGLVPATHMAPIGDSKSSPRVIRGLLYDNDECSDANKAHNVLDSMAPTEEAQGSQVAVKPLGDSDCANWMIQSPVVSGLSSPPQSGSSAEKAARQMRVTTISPNYPNKGLGSSVPGEKEDPCQLLRSNSLASIGSFGRDKTKVEKEQIVHKDFPPPMSAPSLSMEQIAEALRRLQAAAGLDKVRMLDSLATVLHSASRQCLMNRPTVGRAEVFNLMLGFVSSSSVATKMWRLAQIPPAGENSDQDPSQGPSGGLLPGFKPLQDFKPLVAYSKALKECTKLVGRLCLCNETSLQEVYNSSFRNLPDAMDRCCVSPNCLMQRSFLLRLRAIGPQLPLVLMTGIINSCELYSSVERNTVSQPSGVPSGWFEDQDEVPRGSTRSCILKNLLKSILHLGTVLCSVFHCRELQAALAYDQRQYPHALSGGSPLPSDSLTSTSLRCAVALAKCVAVLQGSKTTSVCLFALIDSLLVHGCRQELVADSKDLLVELMLGAIWKNPDVMNSDISSQIIHCARTAKGAKGAKTVAKSNWASRVCCTSLKVYFGDSGQERTILPPRMQVYTDLANELYRLGFWA